MRTVYVMALFVAGCAGSGGSPDAVTSDAGVGADANPSGDAGVPGDAGPADARPADALPADSSPADTGPADGGVAEAGVRPPLGWLSGANSQNLGGFVAWRGRPVDVSNSWGVRDSWAHIADPDTYGYLTATKGMPHMAIGIGMLPSSNTDAAHPLPGVTFAACAAGSYDAYFVTLGQNLVAAGRGDAFIRLGWEANGDWYAWSAGNAASSAEWVQCFRHEVTALRSAAPHVKIDWNMNADTLRPWSGNPTDIYPGDAYVDVVGVDFYDNWPPLDTDQAWAQHLMDHASGGGPHGIGAWLAFAQAHGKPLSVPEWGIVDSSGYCCGGDDAVFVRHMFEFFAQNASSIAYEIYFNLGNYPGDTTFLVFPDIFAPNAAAAYQTLF